MRVWGVAPPSKGQRWIARHAVALQVALACLAVASGVLFVIIPRSEGWGASVVSPLLNTVVFTLFIWAPRGIARYVAEHDRTQGTGPD